MTDWNLLGGNQFNSVSTDTEGILLDIPLFFTEYKNGLKFCPANAKVLTCGEPCEVHLFYIPLVLSTWGPKGPGPPQKETVPK